MIAALKARRIGKDRDEGFTLIELMVVVLIIAILLAIAIPTFLGARSSANARAAQSNLNNAYTNAKSIAAQQNTWDAAGTVGDTAPYTAAEPALNWVDSAPTSSSVANTVSIQATTSSILYLAAEGANGYCYYIDDSSYATTPSTPVEGYAATKGAACDGPATEILGPFYATFALAQATPGTYAAT